MSRIGLIAILLSSWACIGFSAAAFPSEEDRTFSHFYADFQKAVKTGDKEKVAGLTDFAGFTWEGNDKLQRIKTKEAFIKNYDSIFTSAIKDRVATSKPVKIDDDSYFISWQTGNLEYSFHFLRNQDESFRFEGLSAGPR